MSRESIVLGALVLIVGIVVLFTGYFGIRQQFEYALILDGCAWLSQYSEHLRTHPH